MRGWWAVGMGSQKSSTPTKQTLLGKLRGFAGKCVRPAADNAKSGAQIPAPPNGDQGSLGSPSSQYFQATSEYWTPRSRIDSETASGEPLVQVEIPDTPQSDVKPVSHNSVLGVRAVTRVKSLEAIKAAVDRWQGNEDSTCSSLEAPGTPGQGFSQVFSVRSSEVSIAGLTFTWQAGVRKERCTCSWKFRY